jgi:hypothetical protein
LVNTNELRVEMLRKGINSQEAARAMSVSAGERGLCSKGWVLSETIAPAVEHPRFHIKLKSPYDIYVVSMLYVPR